MRTPLAFVAVLWLVLLLACSRAHAAGGHFDVDDATMLAEGHCQVESWFTRFPAAATSTVHLGPACRLGPVELGVNLDHPTVEGDSVTSGGPQVKWVVDPIAPRLSAGLVWAVAFQPHERPGHTAYAAVTWFATDSLQFHANGGADWSPAGGRKPRWGGAAEWAANDTWTVLAERVRYAGRPIARAGLRLNITASTSVDTSLAQVGRTDSTAGGRAYAIGLNHEFER